MPPGRARLDGRGVGFATAFPKPLVPVSCRPAAWGVFVLTRLECHRLGRFSLLAGLVALVAGCGVGGKVAHLSGQVTLRGKPLPTDAQAFVTFVSAADSKRSVSVPIAAGRYDSPETPVGPGRAFFEITTTGPEKISDRTGQPYRDVISHVPAGAAEGIPLEVTGDNPDQNFDLTD